MAQTGRSGGRIPPSRWIGWTFLGWFLGVVLAIAFIIATDSIGLSGLQSPLAIGMGGRNVRLASEIVGWSIELKTPAEYEAEILAQEGGEASPARGAAAGAAEEDDALPSAGQDFPAEEGDADLGPSNEPARSEEGA